MGVFLVDANDAGACTAFVIWKLPYDLQLYAQPLKGCSTCFSQFMYSPVSDAAAIVERSLALAPGVEGEWTSFQKTHREITTWNVLLAFVLR